MIVAILATGVLGACSDGDGEGADDPTSVPSSPVAEEALPSIGDVPEPVAGDVPDVEVRRCELDGDQVDLEVLITNHLDVHGSVQRVPVTVRVGEETISAQEESFNWVVTLGPGRQALARDTFDVDVPAPGQDDVSCELGDATIDPDRLGAQSGASSLDADSIELDGCAEGDDVHVTNPTDNPARIDLAVEFFDDNGFSIGTLEYGQAPMHVDGSAPSSSDVALPGGAQASYTLTMDELIDAGNVEADGSITSCQVVAATYEEDPEPGMVIVD